MHKVNVGRQRVVYMYYVLGKLQALKIQGGVSRLTLRCRGNLFITKSSLNTTIDVGQRILSRLSRLFGSTQAGRYTLSILSTCFRALRITLSSLQLAADLEVFYSLLCLPDARGLCDKRSSPCPALTWKACPSCDKNRASGTGRALIFYYNMPLCIVL